MCAATGLQLFSEANCGCVCQKQQISCPHFTRGLDRHALHVSWHGSSYLEWFKAPSIFELLGNLGPCESHLPFSLQDSCSGLAAPDCACREGEAAVSGGQLTGGTGEHHPLTWTISYHLSEPTLELQLRSRMMKLHTIVFGRSALAHVSSLQTSATS